MHYYGAQTGDDVNAREAYRAHPWFDATVEFCERYDEQLLDPAYDWAAPGALRAGGRGSLLPRACLPLGRAKGAQDPR